MPEFIKLCAWCGKELSRDPLPEFWKDSQEDIISHGMCPDCEKKEEDKIKENNG